MHDNIGIDFVYYVKCQLLTKGYYPRIRVCYGSAFPGDFYIFKNNYVRGKKRNLSI